MPKAKRPKGSPPRPLPERIEASPEVIAKAMFKLPADHNWKYLEKEVANDSSE